MATTVREVIAERTRPEPQLPDNDFIRFQAPLWNLAIDRYFRLEVRGWKRLPDAPALVVGVHAGGLIPIDAYTFGFSWYRRFG
jgi:1-acyl-sn-glycerol-3-phosphate acyltransferase